jgi:hypothetical protein
MTGERQLKKNTGGKSTDCSMLGEILGTNGK